MAGRRRMQHGLQSGTGGGYYRLAIDPWQAECNRECTKNRASDKISSSIWWLCWLSHAFHFQLSFGTTRVIALWGYHALQGNFFHRIFTGRILNIFAKNDKLGTVLRLLERKEAFPKDSSFYCNSRAAVGGSVEPLFPFLAIPFPGPLVTASSFL